MEGKQSNKRTLTRPSDRSIERRVEKEWTVIQVERLLENTDKQGMFCH